MAPGPVVVFGVTVHLTDSASSVGRTLHAALTPSCVAQVWVFPIVPHDSSCGVGSGRGLALRLQRLNNLHYLQPKGPQLCVVCVHVCVCVVFLM